MRNEDTILKRVAEAYMAEVGDVQNPGEPSIQMMVMLPAYADKESGYALSRAVNSCPYPAAASQIILCITQLAYHLGFLAARGKADKYKAEIKEVYNEERAKYEHANNIVTK